MYSTHLPVEPFDVGKVGFYVIGSDPFLDGAENVLYDVISAVTGRRKIHLKLVAVTDQETSGNMTEMNEMGRYGKKYLQESKRLLRKQGYLVTGTEWFGIMHPHNLAVMSNAPDRIVLDFSSQ